MSTAARLALTALLPLVALAVLLFALLLLLIDVLCTPFVLLARRRPTDAPPRSTNASIVVLNWNGLHFLRELMPSLRVAVARCPGDHEVIVVDNGSDDGSIGWLAAEHGWARLVRLPRNLHFIRGNAAGAAAATRDLIVYLNNDMRVEPDWLVELLRPFGPAGGGNADLFAATSRIEMTGERRETGLTRCFVRHGELRFVQVPGAPGGPVPALWAGGGSSAFDRAKHDAIGGFEALYEPCYVEDVSLSWQAWRRGWRVAYVHGSVVHHAHRGSTARAFGRERLERLDWRNRELFFVRGVTDPVLVIVHALAWAWNLRKRARLLQLPLAHGVLATLAAVPRLPRAVWQRERSRVHYRRTDRAVLRAAGCISAPASPR
jgi:GT2 family glycosyltransferase